MALLERSKRSGVEIQSAAKRCREVSVTLISYFKLGRLPSPPPLLHLSLFCLARMRWDLVLWAESRCIRGRWAFVTQCEGHRSLLWVLCRVTDRRDEVRARFLSSRYRSLRQKKKSVQLVIAEEESPWWIILK